MNKLTVIALGILVLAGVASANVPNLGHQCSPEPITMLALIPGVAMILRRRSNKA
jgi:hypothetical protein